MLTLKKWIDYLETFNPSPHKSDTKGVGTTLQAIARLQLLPVSNEMLEIADDLMENHPDVRFFVDHLQMLVDDGQVVVDTRPVRAQLGESAAALWQTPELRAWFAAQLSPVKLIVHDDTGPEQTGRH